MSEATSEAKANRVPLTTDPETGEELHLRPLVMMGEINPHMPEMNTATMLQFASIVAKTANYNQRKMPLWSKIVVLYRIFLELFFNLPKKKQIDPYVFVAVQWFEKQQPPVTFGQKWRKFSRRVRELFLADTLEPEQIKTFGMPLFQDRSAR